MTTDLVHPETPEAHPDLQSEALARALAQRLAVERAARQFQTACRWWDEARARRVTCMMPDEEMLTSWEHLRLVLRATGWPAAGGGTREDLLRRVAGWPLRRLLRVEAGRDLSDHHLVSPYDSYEDLEATGTLPVQPQLVSELRPTFAPVTVLIGEGTTKEEATRLLTQVLKEVKNRYQELLLAPQEDPGPEPTSSDGEDPPEWEQILTIEQGSYRSSWWRGGAVLSPTEAEDLVDWLRAEITRAKAQGAEDGDDLPF